MLGVRELNEPNGEFIMTRPQNDPHNPRRAACRSVLCWLTNAGALRRKWLGGGGGEV